MPVIADTERGRAKDFGRLFIGDVLSSDVSHGSRDKILQFQGLREKAADTVTTSFEGGGKLHAFLVLCRGRGGKDGPICLSSNVRTLIRLRGQINSFFFFLVRGA